MIIQKRCRHDLLVRMLLRLQLHGRIHIHHQLQLQPIIQRRQVKLSVARFIINDLHIHMLAILRRVDPVDPPPKAHLFLRRQSHIDTFQIICIMKGHLVGIRRKLSLFQLFLQGQHRSGQHPAHSGNSILIPGTAVQNGLPILRRVSLQCLLYLRLPELSGKIKPGVLAL